jgi:hypothetical protein
MSKSYTPVYHYPPAGGEPFAGELVGEKVLKDLRTLPPEHFGG